MCQETTDCQVTIKGSHAHEGVDTIKNKPIDACIADIVQALETAGIHMYGSCCGHTESPGEIVLADGRRLRILYDMTIPWARKADWQKHPPGDTT